MQVGDESGMALRRKNRAILAYLALSQRPSNRPTLAALFFQQAADPLRSLRLSLSRLRGALGEGALVLEGERVWVNQGFFMIDAAEFQNVLALADVDSVPLETLEKTVDLYRGEFLAGLHLPDTPEFEMWLVSQRSYFRQLYERGALALVKRLTTESQHQKALAVALQLVQHNPLLEEAHYHLIWLYGQTDQRTAAVEQFHHCQTILQEELAVEPMPEIISLYEDILAGRLTKTRITIRPTPALPTTQAADFVGREAEWQRLNQAWTRTQQGSRRIILISAEAGGGKTRLVKEWAASLPADLFFSGPCYESTRTLAYQPWQTLLAQLYERLDPAEVAQALPTTGLRALARLLPPLATRYPPSEQGHQDQLLVAVHALLGLAGRPFILFLDDLQWADAASLTLVHFLTIQRLTPVLFIAAYRPEEAQDNAALLSLLRDWQGKPDVRRLELEPLTAETVSQLIRRLWPQLAEGFREPHLRDRLLAATGGNPLFLNEIIRELAGAGRLPEELPVPPSLRALVQRRLAELPASGRQVLESLALLAQPAEFDLVREISGRSEEETLTALELGLGRRLLVSTTEMPPLVDFRHDLMGQAVREQLSPIRRQRLHQRTAVQLSSRDSKAAILAYHWGRAGDLAQERQYAVQAGHDAAALYAYSEAAGYWQRALALTTESWQQAGLYALLGQAHFHTGDWDEAEGMFQAGLALVAGQETAVTADLQTGYGLLLEYRGNFEKAMALDQSALAYFRTKGDRPQIARTLGLIALLHWRQGRYDEALTYCREALADPEAMTDPTTKIRLLNISGLIYWRQRDYQQADDYLQQARQLALQFQDRRYQAIVLGNMGNVVQDRGHYQRAITLYQKALELYQEINDRMGHAVMLGNIGLMYFYLGEDERAVDFGHQALALDQQMGNQESVARHLSNLANSFSRMERYEQAFENCREALEIDAGLGNRRGALIHAGNLSTIYLLWGQTAEALACLAYALYLDDRLEHTRELARHLVDIAAVYLFDNELDKAQSVMALAMPVQERLAIDFELAWAYLVAGRLEISLEQAETAVRLLNLAEQTAQKASRADLVFEARVRLPQALWLAGELTVETAVEQLENLIDPSLSLRQLADVYFGQWQISQRERIRDKARQAYEACLAAAYTAEAYQRAEALGAANLPSKPIRQPLPAVITATTPELDLILGQVEQASL